MRKSLTLILSAVSVFVATGCGNSQLNNRPQAAPNPSPIDPPLTGPSPRLCADDVCPNLPANPSPAANVPIAPNPPASNPSVSPVTNTPAVLPIFSALVGKWQIESSGSTENALLKWTEIYQGIRAVLEIKESGIVTYTGKLTRTRPRPFVCNLNFTYKFVTVSATEFRSSQGVSPALAEFSPCVDINKDLKMLFQDKSISFMVNGNTLKLQQKDRVDSKAVIQLRRQL